MYVPVASAVKSLYEQDQQQGLQTAFPYWAKLWPSSIALARFIAQHPSFITGKNVLEIAAGLGLPSLVAAPFAASIHCTDISEEAMVVAEQSAALAGFQHMHCYTMNWNEINESVTADTLMLSDVNYEPEFFKDLLQVIESFLKKGTTILLATPQRLMAKIFVERLMPYCPYQEALAVNDSTGLHHISLFVLEEIL